MQEHVPELVHGIDVGEILISYSPWSRRRHLAMLVTEDFPP